MPAVLGKTSSKENAGKKVQMDHGPGDEEELCGGVRGERLDPDIWEVGLNKLLYDPLLCLTLARFCLSMSAGAEAVRSNIEELPFSWVPAQGGSKELLSGTLRKLLEAGEKELLLLGEREWRALQGKD